MALKRGISGKRQLRVEERRRLPLTKKGIQRREWDAGLGTEPTSPTGKGGRRREEIRKSKRETRADGTLGAEPAKKKNCIEEPGLKIYLGGKA